MDCSDLLGHVRPLVILRCKGDDITSIVGLPRSHSFKDPIIPKKTLHGTQWNVRGSTVLGLSKMKSHVTMFRYGQGAKSKMTKDSWEVPRCLGGQKKYVGLEILGSLGIYSFHKK